jgi:hypothetical protein
VPGNAFFRVTPEIIGYLWAADVLVCPFAVKLRPGRPGGLPRTI